MADDDVDLGRLVTDLPDWKDREELMRARRRRAAASAGSEPGSREASRPGSGAAEGAPSARTTPHTTPDHSASDAPATAAPGPERGSRAPESASRAAESASRGADPGSRAGQGGRRGEVDRPIAAGRSPSGRTVALRPEDPTPPTGQPTFSVESSRSTGDRSTLDIDTAPITPVVARPGDAPPPAAGDLTTTGPADRPGTESPSPQDRGEPAGAVGVAGSVGVAGEVGPAGRSGAVVPTDPTASTGRTADDRAATDPMARTTAVPDDRAATDPMARRTHAMSGPADTATTVQPRVGTPTAPLHGAPSPWEGDEDRHVHGSGEGYDEPRRGRRRRRRRSVWRRLALAVVLIVLVLGGYYAFTLWQVWDTGRSDQARSVDAIVVMGAAQYDGRPSPQLAARLEHVADLWPQRIAPMVVVTGGNQPGDRFTEAEASSEYLTGRGVPGSAILMEDQGTTTLESLQNVAAMLEERGAESVLIVTDPYHALRSRMIAAELGLDAYVSPTETSVVSGREAVKRHLEEAAGVAVGRLIGFDRLSGLTD